MSGDISEEKEIKIYKAESFTMPPSQVEEAVLKIFESKKKNIVLQ